MCCSASLAASVIGMDEAVRNARSEWCSVNRTANAKSSPARWGDLDQGAEAGPGRARLAGGQGAPQEVVRASSGHLLGLRVGGQRRKQHKGGALRLATRASGSFPAVEFKAGGARPWQARLFQPRRASVAGRPECRKQLGLLDSRKAQRGGAEGREQQVCCTSSALRNGASPARLSAPRVR